MTNNEVDVFRQSRINCKSRLTKFKTFLDRCIDQRNSDSVTVEEIRLRLNKLDENWIEYDKAQLGLEMFDPNPTRGAERSDFEETYYRYSAIVLKLINERSASSNVINERGGDTDRHLSRIAELEAELSAQRTNEKLI